jgi:adenylate cyclase class 2
MPPASTEIEIKLRYDSANRARGELLRLGARVTRERHFEDNILYDREHEPLASSGKLLRLRRVGDRALLTYKAPTADDSRYKVRLEHESAVDDPEAVARVLEGLGFRPGYRYQKHRTVFELEGLQLCLDETPIGCFVELEGAPEAIDRSAALLGFGVDDYIRQSYRELHALTEGRRGQQPGDMVF